MYMWLCAGALWEGHDLVRQALGNRTNCLQLGAYGQDILRVFDAEGEEVLFLMVWQLHL